MTDIMKACFGISAVTANLKQVDCLVLHVALKMESPFAVYVP